MAILEQDKLTADDCTEMILSMWFKLPDDLPGDTNPTAEADDEHNPEGHPIRGFSHTYILMEWGGYTQVYSPAYYGVMPQVLTTIAYDSTVPYLDPEQINWYTRPNDAPNFPNPALLTFYVWLPDTPFFFHDPFAALNPYPPVDPGAVVDSVKRGEFHYTNPKVLEPDGSPATFTNAEGWGAKTAFGGGTVSDLPGPPSIALATGEGAAAEFWVPQFAEFNKFYNYEPPSSIYVNAFDDLENPTTLDGYSVTVDIGGALFGPLGAGLKRPQGIGTINPPWPGQTVVPRLTMRVPRSDDPDDPHPPGSEEKPLATRDAWHHLLVCIKLAGPNMCEEIPVEANPPDSLARYLDNTMYVLLDGVAYGGKPWPQHIKNPDTEEDLGNRLVDRGNAFEGGAIEDINNRPYQYLDLQNTSFETGHGIAVKDLPFHIPYDKRWLRTDLSDWEFDKYPDFWGWRGGDTKLDVIKGGPFLGSSRQNTFFPVPALQFANVSTGVGDATTIPPQTHDIKRQYSDVQIWFGKYLDPTDPSNLRLFLEIERNTDGELVGNIPALDQVSLDAYHAAQANDPTVKILSLAAAPNHLGTPDIYLAGGAGPFIHDRGKEGDHLVKTGTIKSVPGPEDIPIPESAVKPPGL